MKMTFEELIQSKDFDKKIIARKVSKGMDAVNSWCRGDMIPRETTLNLLSQVLMTPKDEIRIAMINGKGIKHEKASCECGCGKKFNKRNDAHMFYSVKCRLKSHKKRSADQKMILNMPDDSHAAQQNNFYNKLKRFGVMEEEYEKDFIGACVKEFRKNG